MSNVIELSNTTLAALTGFRRGQAGIKACHERAKARLQQVAPRIKATYGVSEEYDIKEIDKAECELALCRHCNGECVKQENRYQIPAINVDDVWGLSISRGACKFGRMRQMFSKCRNAQIPLKYAGKSFDDYQVTDDNRRAVTIAKAFCSKKPSQGIYFFGKCGTGKTFLAAIIAQEFLSDFQTVIFGDVPTLLDEIKRTFGGGNTSDLFDRYCDCDLLVLDDIGTGKVTDWSVGQIYQLLNRRYNSEKPTIITSNHDLKDLQQKLIVRDSYGNIIDDYTCERIASRLSEMCVQAFLGTTDRRRQKK